MGARVRNPTPTNTPASTGLSASRAHSTYKAAMAVPTTWAANQTVPCSAVKKYTVPKAKSRLSSRLNLVVRPVSPMRRSFSMHKNSTAGAMPASQRKN